MRKQNRTMRKAVIFDVDGVLLDSLPAHLQFCINKAVEYGLDIQMPDETLVRQWLADGRKISPMENFFLAAGFPQGLADKGAQSYATDFHKEFAANVYPGVQRMLITLKGRAVLGLVTSNTRVNIESALGNLMPYFHPDLCYYVDSYPDKRPKHAYLRHIVHCLDVTPDQVLYVGDLPSDREAARIAGTRFLAVTYGWGFGIKDRAATPMATTPADVARHVALDISSGH